MCATPFLITENCWKYKEEWTWQLALERFVEASHPATWPMQYSLVNMKKDTSTKKKLLVLYAISAVHMMERGLTELQWCHYNYTVILEELMPWYIKYPDFSILEVNRYAIPINFYLLNYMYAISVTLPMFVVSQGNHWLLLPQISRVDNIDGGCLQLILNLQNIHNQQLVMMLNVFFSVMRDLIGKDFSMKQAKSEFRKLSWNFANELILILNSNYHTSAHTWSST